MIVHRTLCIPSNDKHQSVIFMSFSSLWDWMLNCSFKKITIGSNISTFYKQRTNHIIPTNHFCILWPPCSKNRQMKTSKCTTLPCINISWNHMPSRIDILQRERHLSLKTYNVSYPLHKLGPNHHTLQTHPKHSRKV